MKNNFTSVPGHNENLFSHFRDTLSKCDKFENNQSVKEIFRLVDKLNPWKNDVQESPVKKRRIENIFSTFRDKYTANNENVLVLIVEFIYNDTDEQDGLKKEFETLLSRLKERFEENRYSKVESNFDPVESSNSVMSSMPKANRRENDNQLLDKFGIASAKSHLNVLSELVAKEAAQLAAHASSSYPNEILSLMVPLIVDLRWNRGYKAALDRLFKIVNTKRRIKEFSCSPPQKPCTVKEGILSAKLTKSNVITVYINEEEAAIITKFNEEDGAIILETINNRGRLPAPEEGGLSLLERIEELPIQGNFQNNEIESVFLQNRDVIQALLARTSFPQLDYFLPKDPHHPEIGKPLFEDSNKGSKKNVTIGPFITKEKHKVEKYSANKFFNSKEPSQNDTDFSHFSRLLRDYLKR